jgi:Flp pilus assembly pilin Flp
VRNPRSLLGDHSGAAAVEYGLLIAAFAGVILFVLFFVGNLLNGARAGVAGGGVPGSPSGGPDAGTFIRTSPGAQ